MIETHDSVSYKDELKKRDSRSKSDAQTARGLEIHDLLQSLEMNKLGEVRTKMRESTQIDD